MAKKKLKQEKVRIRFCPKCKGQNIEMLVGGISGLWKCRKCGFTSPIFPEEEVIITEEKNA